jgi:hypothetical protein
MTAENTANDLEAALARALEPLRAEVRALREEVAVLRADLSRGSSPVRGVEPVAPLQPADTATSAEPVAQAATQTPAPDAPDEAAAPALDIPLAAPIPPERSDFARMLQRGLAQEAVEHPEDSEAAGPDRRKRGWNPFKR